MQKNQLRVTLRKKSRHADERHWDTCSLHNVRTRCVQKVLQLDHKEEWKCYKQHFFNIITTEFSAFATFFWQTVNSTKTEIFCLPSSSHSLVALQSKTGRDRSRESCVCDCLRDATGLDLGDRSWIYKAALDSFFESFVDKTKTNYPQVHDCTGGCSRLRLRAVRPPCIRQS